MNIVIPMAGEGRRFAEAGYDKPKPLIDVAGKPMIERVVDCLRTSDDDTVIAVTRTPIFTDGVDVVVMLNKPTQGAADTLLRAPLTDEPVLVANCDQLVAGVGEFVRCAQGRAAGLMTFNSTNPHHSYVRLSHRDLVSEIAEKRVISDNAVLGVYWFSSGLLLEEYAEKAVATAERVNGEVYISAIFDLLIKDGHLVSAPYEVDVHDKHMLGTPEELRIFLDKVEDGRVVL